MPMRDETYAGKTKPNAKSGRRQVLTPPHHRPHLPKVTPQKEYFELVEILKNKPRWKEAHSLFSNIRTRLTLNMNAEDSSSDHYFIYIAENAAKTAYNCSGESAPFDDDSFDWLLRCERQFLDNTSAPSGRPRNI